MVGMGKGWPSRSGQILVLLLIRMWIYDHHFTLLNIRRLAFYTIYCHSREDDTATALAEFALSKCSCNQCYGKTLTSNIGSGIAILWQHPAVGREARSAVLGPLFYIFNSMDDSDRFNVRLVKIFDR